MSNLTNANVVEQFWIQFDEIYFSSNLDNVKKEQGYENLLRYVLKLCSELVSSYLDNEPTSSISNTPLLAMVSEIQLAAPNVVERIATKSKAVQTARILLADYTPEKRYVLRKYILGRDFENRLYNYD